MNLQEFINLRAKCPFCDTSLITRFISDRKQMVRLEDGRFVAVMTMRALSNSQQDYQVGYSFGLTDNSFQIEFYTEWDTYNQVPIHLIDKFKEFHKNVSGSRYRFARQCTFCNKYLAYTDQVNVDLKGALFNDLSFRFEIFLLTTPTEDGCKIVRLENRYPEEKSDLCWWRDDKESLVRVDTSVPIGKLKAQTNLPLIPFVSKEETGRRLNNLITFA